jgi:hypothetical protein
LFLRLYQKHDQSKLNLIPGWLEKYKGRLAGFVRKVCEKYGEAIPSQAQLQNNTNNTVNTNGQNNGNTNNNGNANSNVTGTDMFANCGGILDNWQLLSDSRIRNWD